MVEDIEQIYKRTEQHGRIQFVEEIDKLQCEKQQLISFLEDKIKETTPNIKTDYYDEDGFKKAQEINNSNIIMIPAHIVYQEVLDYVKVGAK